MASDPLVSDIEIMQLVESVCVDDSVVPVWEAHRVAVFIRDYYEAKIAKLRETIRVVTQPDFVINLEDD